MKNIIFLLILLSACKDNLNINNNNKNKSIQNNNIKNTRQLSDDLRQKDIQEDYNKDNFKLDELKNIDWSDTKNYGNTSNFIVLNKNESANYIINSELFKNLGAKDSDYYIAKVKPDGNCWLTASALTIFYLIFNDDEIFKQVIEDLPKLLTSYESVPGFKDRFLYKEFTTLLQAFKKLTPQERIISFNKEKSYKLINYTLRSLLHAHSYENNEQEELKKLLTDNQWGESRNIINFFTNFIKKPVINLFLVANNAHELSFIINNIYSTIIDKDALNNFFNDNLDDNYKTHFIKSSLQEFKQTFMITKKEDLLKQPLLQVIPMYINKNHYNLLIKKDIATKFGY